MIKKFKVLVSCGQYVDENLLQKGVYSTAKPMLHHDSETIETLKSRMDDFEVYFSGFSAAKAKESLDRCELVPIEITFTY